MYDGRPALFPTEGPATAPRPVLTFVIMRLFSSVCLGEISKNFDSGHDSRAGMAQFDVIHLSSAHVTTTTTTARPQQQQWVRHEYHSGDDVGFLLSFSCSVSASSPPFLHDDDV